MQVKGRTVAMLVTLSVFATILVTMFVTDKLEEVVPVAASTSVASAATDQGTKMTEAELKQLNTVLDLLQTNYVTEIDREKLIDGAISGMMNALDDPYSVYMEAEVANRFSQSIEGSFSGIGAEVSLENGQVVVVSPIKGSPAERGGLLAKDIILSVNGESLAGLTLQEAVELIRGEKGTKAKLEVMRSGHSDAITVVLIRDDIDIETVYSDIDEQGIGLIEITQFSQNTSERFAEELAALEEKGLKGLVIDVRNNPGGVLQDVVEIAQLMMKEGTVVVQVEGRSGKRDKTYATGGEQKKYPIAVLTNGGSASASEILAGALQEGAGATVVGEQTYGKGTVQVSYNQLFDDGGLIKMTIAKWLTPKGNWINETGVTPNIVVEPPLVYSIARLNLNDDEELKEDQLSEKIRSAQIMLDTLGYSVDREDGYFSKKTSEAVRKFQKDHSLSSTGVINKQTSAKLEEKIIAFIRDKANDPQLQKAIEIAGRK
ncbi:S41 family peptidase [Paenibacillus camelliae]|uniref:S41 family peptidase n=1 Tax=Paenibacillus camelliae TaxID=512410 RepID=UPI00203DB62E|nr:S41 family peptidase [Paenibacillus camelliae]MCM3635926.1 S41 family peptidase [Paenibacillus camelliae]